MVHCERKLSLTYSHTRYSSFPSIVGIHLHDVVGNTDQTISEEAKEGDERDENYVLKFWKYVVNHKKKIENFNDVICVYV